MRKRPVRVTVWLTESELEEIRQACGVRGSMSEYLRDAAKYRSLYQHVHENGARTRKKAPRAKPVFVDGGLFRALDCHLPAS